MSGSRTVRLPLVEVAGVVSGFRLQREAMNDGQDEFVDQVGGVLLDLFGDLESVDLVEVGGAFSVVAMELLGLAALYSGESADDLWSRVVRDLHERTEREEGEE